jgi:hypothetical protein
VLLLSSLLGFLAMAVTGLVAAGRMPGIHFDEAWAANFAYRIATEKGFWPLDAMSPYTSPWAHYWIAGFFKLFGANFFVYRAAGLSMCMVGAALACLSLVRVGEKKAAALLPWILAFFVPFVMNSRLSVEITTFHIFCLGLLMFGAQIRSGVLSIFVVFLAVVLGITSHILFAAPVLGCLAVWFLRSGRWQREARLLVFLAAVGLLPFFWHVYRSIPEKDKALAILSADIAVVVGVLIFERTPRAILRIRDNLWWLIGILSLPFWFYLLVFSEGDWSVLFAEGRIASPWVLFLSVPFTLGAAVYLARAYRRKRWGLSQQRFWNWVIFTVLCLGVLAVKPAPRYFEMGFFLLAIGTAVLLGQLPKAKIVRFLVPFITVSGAILFFKDDSSDSLPKQDLARYLGSRGCSFAQVTTGDPRLAQALQFLSYGDWPVMAGAQCPSAHVSVARLADGDPQPGVRGENFEQFRIVWE